MPKPVAAAQDPQARPAASDLQRHPFVAAPRAGAALAALRPLIRRSREAARRDDGRGRGPPEAAARRQVLHEAAGNLICVTPAARVALPSRRCQVAQRR